MTLRAFVLAAAALACAACGAPAPQSDVVETQLPQAAAQTASTDRQRLGIDPAQSWLRVRVYRSGRLARFGHNHVVSSAGLAGYVELGATPAESEVVIDLPLASLAVDEPAAREAEGADFAAAVPIKDRDATRQNMLGDALLNAAAFPDITLRSVRIDGELPELVIVTEIALAGRKQTVELPATVTMTERRVVATGDVSVTHEALGLTPFSALLGALRVRDDIGLHFHIVADATPDLDDTLL